MRLSLFCFSVPLFRLLFFLMTFLLFYCLFVLFFFFFLSLAIFFVLFSFSVSPLLLCHQFSTFLFLSHSFPTLFPSFILFLSLCALMHPLSLLISLTLHSVLLCLSSLFPFDAFLLPSSSCAAMVRRFFSL